jgi:murein DD-endopeptidase MepM/ murein hydrolase activator NlpD
MPNKDHLKLEEYFRNHSQQISAVVEFNPTIDRLLPFNFTKNNKELNRAIITNTEKFSEWIEQKLQQSGSKYGIGGYNEHRTLYSRSDLFNSEEERRSLHLGVDIWGPAGTCIFCPLDAKVHSFKFNDNFGDYGATIILEHDINSNKLYSLYGHLSLNSLYGLHQGMFISKGTGFAELGLPTENGCWPPHLHFQLILNMQGNEGDYPGVCKYSERDIYLTNCPDPNLILKYTFE